MQNAFGHFRCYVVVPGAFGVDDGDGALFANMQAVGFGAEEAAAVERLVHFGDALLQVLPRFGTLFESGALGLGLLGAKENVAFDFADAQVARYGLESLLFFRSYWHVKLAASSMLPVPL